MTLDVDEARQTTRPLASIRSFAAASLSIPAGATRAMRLLLRRATSPRNQALPVPSTTRPPRINTSYGRASAPGAAGGTRLARGSPG